VGGTGGRMWPGIAPGTVGNVGDWFLVPE